MSASPATIGRNLPPDKTRDDKIAIPAKWRVGQFVVLALIALVAIYYFTVGWRSPGESGKVDAATPFDALGFIVLAGLTFLTTPTAGVIAATTFQESLRRRWMSVLLAFGLVVVALSTFFTGFSPGTEQQFLRDFGLGFIIIITMLMAIFLGVALVPPDIERRTIFTILSKPVTRHEFLIGKFLGLCLTLLVNLALLSVMFLAAYALFVIRKEGFSDAMVSDAAHMGLKFNLANLVKGLALQYGMLVILAALSLTLSLVVSNITAIVFCFVIYFAGQMNSFWEHLGHEHAEEGGDAHSPEGTAGLSRSVSAAINIVSFMLPKLDRFDVRQRIVTELPVNFNYMWKAFGNGLGYAAVLLIIAYLVFSDREF